MTWHWIWVIPKARRADLLCPWHWIALDECSVSQLKDNYQEHNKKLTIKLRLYNPALPANSSPGLSQPVNWVRLKGRQDRPERGEVLQPMTVLQKTQLTFSGFPSYHIRYSNNHVWCSWLYSSYKGFDNEALTESCLIQTEGACVDFLTPTAIKNLEAQLECSLFDDFFCGLTCATLIHFSMMRALWAGVVGDQREEAELEVASVGRQSRDTMTWLVMVLNCAMVARMVGDMFSFLSLCDHTQPRHWYGTTLTNRAWNTLKNKSSAFNHCRTIEMYKIYLFTYRVNSGELFGNGCHREIHDATLIQRVFTPWILISRTLLILLQIHLGRADTCLDFWWNIRRRDQEKVSMAFRHCWQLPWEYTVCHVVAYHLSVTFSTAPQPAPPTSRNWADCACCRELQSWSLGDPAAAWGLCAGEDLGSPHCIHPTMSGQRPAEGWGDNHYSVTS